MSLPTTLLLSIYFALMFALALIVRRAYVRGPGGPGRKQPELSIFTRPREERKRLFDWSAELEGPDSVR
jgi:hypothetical protein